MVFPNKCVINSGRAVAVVVSYVGRATDDVPAFANATGEVFVFAVEAGVHNINVDAASCQAFLDVVLIVQQCSVLITPTE